MTRQPRQGGLARTRGQAIPGPVGYVGGRALQRKGPSVPASLGFPRQREGLGAHARACGCVARREQDRFLPIANISRIMKKALPANAKIAKDAKETVQECVSEFISFITSE